MSGAVRIGRGDRSFLCQYHQIWNPADCTTPGYDNLSASAQIAIGNELGDKFAAYRSIESFREYLLIDQYDIHVEHYVKTAANQWLFSEYEDLNVTLSMSTFEAQIPFVDLYKNIDIEEG